AFTARTVRANSTPGGRREREVERPSVVGAGKDLRIVGREHDRLDDAETAAQAGSEDVTPPAANADHLGVEVVLVRVLAREVARIGRPRYRCLRVRSDLLDGARCDIGDQEP